MANEKILVVDDEAPVRESLMRVLRAVGFRVEGASSGPEGIQKLAADSYDLLVVDIRMPGMDGLEMMRQAKARDPYVSGLFLTGYGSIDTAIEALEVGAYGFVLKPVAPDRLLRMVEEALARARTAREAARARALTPLLEMSRALMAERDPENLSSLILKLVQQETKADRASLMLVEGDGTELVIQAAYGLPQEYMGSRRRVQDAIAGWVVEKGEPLLLQDTAAVHPDIQREMTAREIGSGISLPLKAKGKIIGVLNISKKRGSASFTQGDMELFTILAGQVSVAIENARLYENLRRYSQELERDKTDLQQRIREIQALNTFLQTQQARAVEITEAQRKLESQHWGLIRGLASVVDGRCPDRREHSSAVATLAARLAQAMELPGEDLARAAYLHDIGLIVLSEEALSRRGALSAAERELLVQHPRTGAKVIADAQVDPDVRDAVLYHHENYDGSGYPEGLAGDGIPLGARILRVADSVEAMTAPRAYRPITLSRSEALEEVRRLAGKKYDPQVVSALAKVLKKP